MAKIRAFESDGKKSFMVWCPGCDRPHGFDDSWKFNGDLDNPTLIPSLMVTWTYGPDKEARCCHSYITDGKIQFLGDCTHALKFQTVELPEWPYNAE